jgi:LCP family protein required for cell wall assembly
MRTTLKRAAGRAAGPDVTRVPADPLSVSSPVTLYRATAPPPRSRLRRVGRALIGLALTMLALVVGAGGGAFLWFDRSVAEVAAHSPALARAAKQLAIPLPGKPAIALLIGIDTRAGAESGSQNTDTMMLVRADRATHTISLLSFPRDLNVPIYCSGAVVAHDRINAALARCGPKGSLETVGKLTGLPINYLITVDFHGFKEIVDRLGGIWIDVDRTYYNKNVGTASTDYSNIHLQPGYQRLSGAEALAFVRYRHTDSDLYRLAREQSFVRAVKEQVAKNFDPLQLPSLVSAITGSVQVASKTGLSDTTVLEYALFAATLPPGHVVQASIPAGELASVNVGGADELSASRASIQGAVSAFRHPTVVGAKPPKKSSPGHATRPTKPSVPAPPARATTVTVLNGNGIPGAALTASGLLGGRGYRVLPPPGGLPANAPSMNYAESTVYFDPASVQSTAAADSLAKLIKPATVQALPSDPKLHALDPHAMLVVVLGRSFTGELSRPHPVVRQEAALVSPSSMQADVQSASGAGTSLLAPLARRVPFRLETPTVLGTNSQPDNLGGDQPVRLYHLTPANKAVRLVFVTGGNQFWGIEETDWSGAPALADSNLQRDLKGRTYDLYYANGHLHMVVLKAGGATYWVVNTLLNSLSNPTMIAIAEGLVPLGGGHPG